MSIQQVPERSCKKLYHYRRNSDELDVFEAARYFSGAINEVSGYQKMLRSGGRNSLDITILSSTRSSTNQAQTHVCNDVMMEKPTTKEKKYKQPNSPGGRLASFLNSLFSQSSSKKKKSKSCSAQSMKDEDHEIPGGRRKRRSSISHFRSFNSTNNSSSADNSKSSIYSSSSPEFTTHPSITTPTKNTYKDSKNFLDHHKPAVQLKSNCHIKSTTASQKDVHHDTRKISTNHDNAWLDDDDFKFSTTTTTNSNNGFPSERGSNIFLNGSHEKNQPSERDFRNFINEMDDGADSDSSSDLFELQNYDLGNCGYSSGLPVYETTHMNSIKRGAPITS